MDKKTDELINAIKQGLKLNTNDKVFLQNLLKAEKEWEPATESNDFIEVFAKVSEIFNNSTNWKEDLVDVFKLIAKTSDVDRVYYFENSVEAASKRLVSSQKIEWNKAFVEPQIDNPELQNIPLSIYQEAAHSLSNGEPYLAIISQIPNKKLKELFESQEIKSVLIFPVMVNGHFHGFIGFDDCKHERVWTSSEIYILKIVVGKIEQILEKKEIERLLDRTYRQAKIGTWEMKLETDEFIWSPITKEIFEMKDDEIPDRELAEAVFYKEEDRKKILEAVEETMLNGTPYDFELEIETVKGNRKWIRDTGQGEFKDGVAVRIYGTVQDITDRKKAEIESEKNRKLLEAISEQTDVSILVRNNKGEHVFVNNKWRKVFGLEHVDVIGKPVHDVFEKEIADHIRQTDTSIMDAGKPVLFEERVKTVDGYRYYMVNKFPLHGIEGLEGAIGGIGTDISELKETQEKLEKTEQKLRDVVEHSTNLFYSHNTDHELVYLSPQTYLFFGIKPEDAIRRWTDFVTDNPINEVGFEITERAIKTGRAQPRYELEMKRDNGETFWVEVNEAPIVKDGKTVLITGSLTDITDRKRVQLEVRKSLKEKETLLAEIHHRVKNNLAVVASMMQMQAHVSDDEKLSESLLESVLRIKSMANIHEYLYKSQHFADLDFAENLQNLILDVINTMQYTTEIKTTFTCDQVLLNVNQAIPCSLIVNEVVTNIIKHAFPERSEGLVMVSLFKRENRVQLEIADNGVGLPEDFDPERSNTLGMLLIKTLSEQLQATFNYSSDRNGSTFSLIFDKELDLKNSDPL